VIAAPRLSLYPPEHFREFRQVFREMAQRFSLREHLDFNDDMLAVRLMLACQAHLRVLENILRRTETLCLKGGRRLPIGEGLRKAFKQVASDVADAVDPFAMSEKDLALRVNQEKVEFERSQRKRGGEP
jgi:hypothetical protein